MRCVFVDERLNQCLPAWEVVHEASLGDSRLLDHAVDGEAVSAFFNDDHASCSEDLEPRRAAVCPAPHDVLFVVLVGNVFSGVVFNLTHFLASPVVICKGRLRLHSLNQSGLTLLVKDPMGVLLSLLLS